MTKFRFNIDQKETIWRRNHCEVEADTEEEAILKMKGAALDIDYDLHAYDSELIHDTVDDMTYEDNQNQPTREVYYKGNIVGDNTPLSIKRDKKINSIIDEKD